MSELKVYVVEFGDRGVYQLQWRDPITGRKKTRSSGVKVTGKAKDRDQATKKGAALESQLRSNYTATSKAISWSAFRERYEREVATGKAANTASKVVTVFNAVEEHLNPQKLTDLTEERISYLTSELRMEKKAEASIKSTLAHLKASLRWANRMKILATVPAIEMPSRLAEKSKGRPITGEEFERILAAVPKVIERAADVPSWERLLRGLWLSGLRLGEALALSWDDENAIRVDMSGKRPMLVIPAGCDKSGKSRQLAITPDFAELLIDTPQANRCGLVFVIPSRGAKGARLTMDRVKHLICSIGKAANVKVATDANGRVKFASAHDLRRSFGERWSGRLLPQVLMELMRHSDIKTTLTYYVGKNAERTADAVYEAFEVAKGNILANNSDQCEQSPKTTQTQPLAAQEV